MTCSALNGDLGRNPPAACSNLSGDGKIVAKLSCNRDAFARMAMASGAMWGRFDLNDTIRRLNAFSKAGADVLYAPGLADIDAIRTVCQEVDKPVNVVMGLQGPHYSVQELSEAGVRRISVGGSFARAALAALQRAAEEVLIKGTFTYASGAMPGEFLANVMSQERPTSRH